MDVCINTCMDMRVDMLMGRRMDMRVGTCVDMSMGMCVDLHTDCGEYTDECRVACMDKGVAQDRGQ